MAKAKVTSKGQVTIPVEIRERYGIGTGDSLVFEPRGEYVVVRKARTLDDVAAFLWQHAGPRRFADVDDAVAAYFLEAPPDDEGDLAIAGPNGIVKVGDDGDDE